MPIKHGPAILVASSFLALLYWVALTRHECWLWGDPELIFRQSVILRDGYFAHNFRIFWDRIGGIPSAASPIPLEVEGGYPFLLYLARLAGDRLPFLVNALLLPLIPLSLSLLLVRLDANRPRALLSAALLPLMMLCFRQTAAGFWDLAQPYRDAPAYLWGIASLLLTEQAARGTRRRNRLAFAAGLCLGLAAWTRLPMVILAPVAFLQIATASRTASRRDQLLAILSGCAGVGIGVAPFLLQNAIEGRAFWATKKSSQLLMSAATVAYRPELHAGWHPANLALMARPQLEHFLAAFPLWLHAGVGMSFIGWLFLKEHRRRVLVLGGSILMFLVFYSCYYRLVPRYLLFMHLLYLTAAAAAAGALLHAGLQRLRSGRRQTATRAVLMLGILAGTAFGCAREARSWKALQNQWNELIRFREWLHTGMRPADYFVTPDYPVKLMLAYFRPQFKAAERSFGHERPGGRAMPQAVEPSRWLGSGQALSWGHDPLDRSRDPDFDRLVREGALCFVVGGNSRGEPQPSWWMDALLNRYDLDPAGSFTFRLDSLKTFLFYRVRESNRLLRTTAARETTNGAACCLWVYCRPYSSTSNPVRTWIEWDAEPEVERGVASPSIRVERAEEMRSVTTDLRTGPNLVWLPRPLETSPTGLTFTAGSPMRAPAFARWLAAGEWASLRLDDHARVASYGHLFTGAELHWVGYRHWQRDWGGYGESKWESAPYFVLRPDATIRLPFLPPPAGALRVRMKWLAFADDPAALDALRPSGYAFRGEALSHRRSESSAAALWYRNIWSARFTDELIVPASLWDKALPPELTVRGDYRITPNRQGLALRRLEFSPDP